MWDYSLKSFQWCGGIDVELENDELFQRLGVVFCCVGVLKIADGIDGRFDFEAKQIE